MKKIMRPLLCCAAFILSAIVLNSCNSPKGFTDKELVANTVRLLNQNDLASRYSEMHPAGFRMPEMLYQDKEETFAKQSTFFGGLVKNVVWIKWDSTSRSHIMPTVQCTTMYCQDAKQYRDTHLGREFNRQQSRLRIEIIGNTDAQSSSTDVDSTLTPKDGLSRISCWSPETKLLANASDLVSFDQSYTLDIVFLDLRKIFRALFIPHREEELYITRVVYFPCLFFVRARMENTNTKSYLTPKGQETARICVFKAEGQARCNKGRKQDFPLRQVI